MRKLFSIAAAAAILFLAGCEKQPIAEPAVPVEPTDCMIDPWTIRDAYVSLKDAPAGHTTVTATQGVTRTYLQKNGDSRVSVLWTTGDSFEMLTRGSNSGNYHAYFYTYETGPSVEFSADGNIGGVGGTQFHCVYPSIRKFNYTSSTGDYLIGINVPTFQYAIPDGLQEKVNCSYAYTENPSGNLVFRNIISLLRLNLSGEKVASLDSIVFKGTDELAGDLTIVPQNGIPLISSRHFSGDVLSRTITLKGPFQAGKDYYVAIKPGSRPLTVYFYDANGRSRSVTTSTSLDFERGHVTDIGNIPMGEDFYHKENEHGVAVEQYKKATAGSKPVSLAVLSEGFTEDELVDYKMLAHSAIDALFNTEPYKSYKEYFNVWVLSVASNESGASVTNGTGTVTEAHDCFFGSQWGATSYSDMTADTDAINDFVKTYCPDIVDRVHTLAEVPILLLINDERYGGICHVASNSYKYAMVPIAGGGKRLHWAYMSTVPTSDSEPAPGTRKLTDAELAEFGDSYGDWRNIVVHEFGGHCIGRLSDEYWSNSYKSKTSSIPSHSWDIPFGLNISADYSPTPWDDDLLSRRDQLVATNSRYERIGSFQGGDNSIYNRWRNEHASCMMDNRLYFSTWQRDLIVRRILSLADETFNLQSFLAKDVIYDPLRDASSSHAPGLHWPGEPAIECPPLPSPVFSF